jgi:hypothetical protein
VTSGLRSVTTRHRESNNVHEDSLYSHNTVQLSNLLYFLMLCFSTLPHHNSFLLLNEIITILVGVMARSLFALCLNITDSYLTIDK